MKRKSCNILFTMRIVTCRKFIKLGQHRKSKLYELYDELVLFISELEVIVPDWKYELVHSLRNCELELSSVFSQCRK